MNTKKLHFSILILLVLLLFFTGCMERVITEEVMVEVTREVEVTKEVEITKIVYEPVTVTWTPTPENSPTPTRTPTKTPTPTITPTPTNTATITPTPNATQTKQAIINATQGADATATEVARIAKATEIAQYNTIDKKELLTYADQHAGEKIRIEGRIFNINGNTELQIWLGWSYDAAYIIMREPFSGVYEDDWITVYGEIRGEECFENFAGGTTCQPIIIDAFYIKQ